MDNKKERIKELFEHWKEYNYYPNEDTLLEIKCMFLSDCLAGVMTYDGWLDLKFGEDILEVLIQISNRTTFEYIRNGDNYKKYIMVCNFIEGWLNWGTSIRGPWFDGIIEPSTAPCCPIEKYYIKIDKEFMDWFIEWLIE